MKIRVEKSTNDLRKADEQLQFDLIKREPAEHELQQINVKLKAWVEEIEQRNSEITLSREMKDMLQSCLTAEEVYNIVIQSSKILFSYESGALYMFSISQDILEAVSIWGEFCPEVHVFTPNDCWSLRRRRAHEVQDPNSGLICRHVGTFKSPYLCVPLMAQGEPIGILHLQCSLKSTLSDSKKRLAVEMAEQVALVLSNQKLRENSAQSI